MSAFVDRERVFAKAADIVMLTTTAHLGAHPFDLHIHTHFSALSLDDADVNEIADLAARRANIRLAMPVACETLSDLAWLIMLAMEKR